MKKIVALGIIFALFFFCPNAGAEEPQHPLKVFIEANAGMPERVSAVESNTRKRVGKVLLGAVLGAAAGALHARSTGGDIGKEAALGAVAGGAVAFAVTKIQDRRLASREEVAAMVAYDPAQGYRSGVREVTVTPSTVEAGGKITVTTSYWALGPTDSQAVAMSRYAGISIAGAYLRGFTFKPDPIDFGKGGGQFETTIEVQLPPEANPGTYSVVWLLDGYSVNADNEATFVVSG